MVDEHPAGTAVCYSIHKALLGSLHKGKIFLKLYSSPRLQIHIFLNGLKQELEGFCIPV